MRRWGGDCSLLVIKVLTVRGGVNKIPVPRFGDFSVHVKVLEQVGTFFQAFRTMLDGYSREQWKGTDRETTVMYEIAGNAYV